MGTEAKHTPGPLVAKQGHDGEPNRWIVVREKAPQFLIAVIENGAPGDTLETEGATARLIAAAPELLEACRAAKRYLEPDLVEPGRTVFWSLVAAIAKAEGRAVEPTS